MRVRLGCALACLLALACKPSKRCDQARLARLAEAIDAAPVEAHAGLVHEQLAEACGLPPGTQARLDPAFQDRRDPERLASSGFTEDVRRACPSWGRFGKQLAELPSWERSSFVYRECDFARFELIPQERFAAASDSALATFSIYALMLAEGTPESIAKTISRAVFELEWSSYSGPALVAAREDIRLTQVRAGTPLERGEILYVSPDALEFNEKTIVSLDAGQLASTDLQGHFIPSLFDALSEALDIERQLADRRGDEPNARLLLALDARTPVATLVDLVYTGGRAEYADYGLVVEPHFPMRRMLELSAPRFGERIDETFRVFISSEGFRVRGVGDEQQLPLRAGEPDYAGLERLAREHLSANSAASYALVSASDELPVEVLLRAFATLAGPECVQSKPDPSVCLLPRVMLEASV